MPKWIAASVLAMLCAWAGWILLDDSSGQLRTRPEGTAEGPVLSETARPDGLRIRTSRFGIPTERLLQGTVVDERGRAIRGAEVLVWRTEAVRQMASIASRMADGQVRTTRTDGEGAWSLEPGSAGPYEVLVRSRAHAPGFQANLVAGRDVRIVMRAGAPLGGRVVAAGRKLIPLSGATVVLRTPYLASYTDSITETDSEGRFRFERAATMGSRLRGWLQVSHQGHAARHVHVPSDFRKDEWTDLLIPMQEASPPLIEVTSSDGSTIEADVVIWARGTVQAGHARSLARGGFGYIQWERGPRVVDRSRHAPFDDPAIQAGVFTWSADRSRAGFTGPGDGMEGTVAAGGAVAFAEGHAPASVRLPIDRDGPGGTLIDLRLGEPVRLEGRVVDGDGRGVAGARVLPFGTMNEGVVGHPAPMPGAAAPFGSWVATDADGRWVWQDFPRALIAEGLTIRACACPQGLVQQAEVTVRSGDRERVEVPELRFTARRVAVEVRDHRDAPVQGALVALSDQPVADRALAWPVMTGEDGRCLVWLPESDPASTSPAGLHALAHTVGHAWGRVRIEGEASTPVVIRIAPQHAIRGRVVDQHGQPVMNAPVEATDAEHVRMGAPVPHAALRTLATTDEEGRFSITRLGAGPFILQPRAERQVDIVRVEAEPDEREHLLTVTLAEPPSPMPHLTLTVVNGEGELVTDASAEMSCRAGSGFTRMGSRELRPGVVRIDAGGTGRHHVRVEALGHAPTLLHVDFAGKNLERRVVLGSSARLEGRLFGLDDDTDWTRIWIDVVQAAGERSLRTTYAREDGTFFLSGLPRGPAFVRASSAKFRRSFSLFDADYASRWIPVVLGEDGQVEIRVDLTEEAELEILAESQRLERTGGRTRADGTRGQAPWPAVIRILDEAGILYASLRIRTWKKGLNRHPIRLPRGTFQIELYAPQPFPDQPSSHASLPVPGRAVIRLP